MLLKLATTKVFPKILPRKMFSSSSNNYVIVERVGQITTIGLNRPKTRNSLNLETAVLLKRAIEEFEDDKNSYVAVIYGNGGSFCSGFDLKELADSEIEHDIQNFLEHGFMSISKFVKKLMIAAVNGYAVAGGLELALMCDMRVMEETAVMGLFGRRFGVPLTDGATVRLQALIGLSRALDMVVTGRSLSAQEAFEWGLANRIVACGTALGQSMNLASSLLKFPQECLNIDRESTYNAAFQGAYEDLLKQEQNNAKKLSVAGILEGAKKFVSGLGRHGKFYNLTQKEVCEWETEFKKSCKVESKSKL
ncbi:probable enoyl-CoA hydratase echA8 [Leptinotarsa decemlineata]|uniref:probable enoyl-CoA hydratase echA8 n=1 Tax=Leptinotarsa decemlineata TaxID=7539 RepID=UPI000C25401C|nr:uncharacterized protein LOC111507423 [Leptinotarsa decemlineata]